MDKGTHSTYDRTTPNELLDREKILRVTPIKRFDEQFWRPLGGGRYAVLIRMPWGELVPGQVIVASRPGWMRRPESDDPHWSAYPVGSAIVAVRLMGELPAVSGSCLPGLEKPMPVAPAAPEEWSGRLAAAWACQ